MLHLSMFFSNDYFFVQDYRELEVCHKQTGMPTTTFVEYLLVSNLDEWIDCGTQTKLRCSMVKSPIGIHLVSCHSTSSIVLEETFHADFQSTYTCSGDLY